MARRSPLNARYQKNTEPAGKTRRSASAAKPKREAGTTSQAGGAAAKPTKKRTTFREAWNSVPTTPEIKRWNRIWLWLIGGAFVMFALVFLVPQVKSNSTLAYGGLLIYIALLGAAFWIQMFKVRPLRDKAAAEAKAASKKGGK